MCILSVFDMAQKKSTLQLISIHARFRAVVNVPYRLRKALGQLVPLG